MEVVFGQVLIVVCVWSGFCVGFFLPVESEKCFILCKESPLFTENLLLLILFISAATDNKTPVSALGLFSSLCPKYVDQSCVCVFFNSQKWCFNVAELSI